MDNEANELLNKSRRLFKPDDMDNAETFYRQLIELDANNSKAHYQLSRIYYLETCDFEQAIYHAQKALTIKPDFDEAKVTLAELLLMRGNLFDGFNLFDQSRHLYIDKESGRYKFFQMIPRWRGEIFSGKRIIIGEDGGFGGFGDILMFARYLPLVKDRGGYVTLPVKKELFRLFNTLAGVDELLLPSRDSVRPADFDLQIPFVSLPVIFGTSLNTVPASPYLSADPKLTAIWQDRINNTYHALNNTLKVGLVWSGKSQEETLRYRTCAFKFLVPLLKLPRIAYYNLQIGEAAKEISEYKDLNIFDLTDCIEDFADTAAFINNLDLVISVDTAVAHLAGAIGKPVWLILPFVSEWRWLADRDDSPWYPTMRIFRSKKLNDWNGVIEEVYTNLEALV